MKSMRVQKIISLVLAAILAAATLAGCVQEFQEPEETEIISPTPVPVTPVSVADKLFTLNYDAEAGFNPLICGSSTNTEIACLIYEGLFVLDEKFNAVPKLCEEYGSDDGLNWSFRLKPNVAMHDGSYLTAEDAVYSLREAKRTRFASRFSQMSDVKTTGELTFTVTLSRQNYGFIALLDVPVFKNGTGEDFAPIGTGPYIYEKDTSSLRQFSMHRDFNVLSLRKIYLRECEPSKLTRAFTGHEIDLIIEDPLSNTVEDISSGHEQYFYDTTLFQYIGFNTKKGVFTDNRMRKAIGYAVDRQYIVNNIMKGAALPAALVISPALSYYDEEWENGSGYSMYSYSRNLASVGLEDLDSDGFLELPGDSGDYVDLTLDFIVNEDSVYKIKAAQEIVYSVKSVGIDINLRILKWNEYKAALRSGDFDMYYGETLLTPDFSFEQLLSPGGQLNYGGYDNEDCFAAVRMFLSAKDGEEKADAAKQLCRAVSQYAPIIPVLYRKYCVHSNRGVVSGLRPSFSGVLCGISGWKIKL